MADGIRFGPIGASARHVCVDMQRLFLPGSPWEVPELERIVPAVTQLARHQPGSAIFTRFIPPRDLDEARGAWARLYEKWPGVLRENLDDGALELLPELAGLAPAERIIDKTVYSPWLGATLGGMLEEEQVDTLVITGAETEVCVLATLIGAVERGYRVILVTDAVCSSVPETHRATLEVCTQRLGQQIETAELAEVMALWPA